MYLHDVTLANAAQSLPCILAAMVPCTRLYAYIGCQLRAAALSATGLSWAQGPYASWIKEYSSDAFLALPAAKEALLDKLASSEEHGKRVLLGLMQQYTAHTHNKQDQEKLHSNQAYSRNQGTCTLCCQIVVSKHVQHWQVLIVPSLARVSMSVWQIYCAGPHD